MIAFKTASFTAQCVARLVAGVATLMLGYMPASAQTQRPCVGVIPAGGGHAFWNEVEQGALRAGRQLGVDIYFRGPPDENNPQAQVTVINIVESMRCAALVLAPNVAERGADVARLKKAGIPTVYIDRDYPGAEVTAVVATDNFRAGQIAAEQMIKQVGPQGHVAVFHMKRGVQSTDERERGFISAIRAAGLEIVLEVWLGNAVGEARARSSQALSKLTVPLNGIFTPNESTTLATLATLRQFNLAGSIKLIGFDASQPIVEALRSNDLAGVVVQRPDEMGYQGVLIAYRAAQGLAPEKRNVDTGAFYVSRQNLDTPEMKRALAGALRAVPSITDKTR